MVVRTLCPFSLHTKEKGIGYDGQNQCSEGVPHIEKLGVHNRIANGREISGANEN